ncbi:MAG: elongation factor G [Clostridiaceae bacterium]|jgi:elongation factor G|nr:elongation factor G [Clostridiaceae bacterium]
MKTYATEYIRNVALIGHSGEGKTSLAEAILFNAKSVDRLGKVDDGTSAMDYDPEEISRKISISLSAAYAVWKDCKINLIDVPGFFDFEGELISALHVADAAIIVTSATGQLSVGTEKALDFCAEKNTPAFIFVNAVNKENADYAGTVAAITAKYGDKVVPLEIPIITEGKMVGAVNVVTGKAVDLNGKETAVPAVLVSAAADATAKLTELIAETDDVLMEKFFSGESFSDEEINVGLKKAVDTDLLIPVMAGDAKTNAGVTALMDKIIELMPSPFEGRVFTGDADGAEIKTAADKTKPFSAQVFKSVADPFVGKLLLFKVITGKISVGDALLNMTAEKPEKAGALYVLKGKKQETVTEIEAGDIGALAKLSYTNTGDTLVSSSFKIKYGDIQFPDPVISFAAGAAKDGDEEKVIQGLIKMQEEDNTFKVRKDVETGDVLVSGLGEAQLEIMCKRVKNKFGVEAKLSDPKIAYRETVKGTAEAEGKHKKQSGGAGQYGDVFIRFEPGAADGIFEFVDAIVGGAVPRQFIPAVEKGLRESIKKGVLAGYPMVNLKATLYDGKYHPVDSKEIAFVTAAKLSYDEGVAKATPCFLEPIVEVKITIPDNYLGDIMGDMNKRRGRILGTDLAGNKQILTAEVPKAEISRYATDLRSMTQGRGKFTVKFLRYDEVPFSMAPKIIEEAKKRGA